MIVQTGQWGKSIGLRLPNSICKEFHIGNRSRIEVIRENDEIILRPKKYNLDNMLSKITEENFHEEIFPDAGMIGCEVW